MILLSPTKSVVTPSRGGVDLLVHVGPVKIPVGDKAGAARAFHHHRVFAHRFLGEPFGVMRVERGILFLENHHRALRRVFFQDRKEDRILLPGRCEKGQRDLFLQSAKPFGRLPGKGIDASPGQIDFRRLPGKRARKKVQGDRRQKRREKDQSAYDTAPVGVLFPDLCLHGQLHLLLSTA